MNGRRVSSSGRRKSAQAGDTWSVVERPDGLWAMAPLAAGWRVEHRVAVVGATPITTEIRIVASDPERVPAGGIDSDLVRRITLRGAKELLGDRLRPVAGDLRGLEALAGPARRRRGEARRWGLALAALGYLHAIRVGSRHPSRDAAKALGLHPTTVRDRLHAARTEPPPMLTGGGRRGHVGDVHLTAEVERVVQARVDRIHAALGYGAVLRIVMLPHSLGGVDAVLAYQLGEAERAVPRLWEMDIAEIVRRSPHGWDGQPPGIVVRIDDAGLIHLSIASPGSAR